MNSRLKPTFRSGLKIHVLPLLFILGSLYTAGAQTYMAFGNGTLYRIIVDPMSCNPSCSIEEVGPTSNFGPGTSFCPDGQLYGMIGNDLYQIDPSTGNYLPVYINPGGIETEGVACSEDSIFYAIGFPDGELYAYNINADSYTLIGQTGFQPDEEMAVMDGEYYFNTIGSIVRVDLLNPENSEVVMTYDISEVFIAGLSASSKCNTLMAINGMTNELITINLGDGKITPLCTLPNLVHNLTSISEFETSTCAVYIDLDCDDSSGATGADYFLADYDCHSEKVFIADDILIDYDDLITEMHIHFNDPLPNYPFELINILHGNPLVTTAWDGHEDFWLTNNGSGTVADFIDLLSAIYYWNYDIPIIPGLRSFTVQFTTASGAMSNIATAYVNVIAGSNLTVDLGPDTTICSGQIVTFNAGNPGAMYNWNNGLHSQTITVSSAGNYIVTVLDGVNCPARDTVHLTVLPNVIASLTGDTEICDDETAQLLITTGQIPVDFEITASNGTVINFDGVTGNLPFSQVIDELTTFTITNATSSAAVCIVLSDSTQTIDFFPTYASDADELLCDGDSLWLGFYWVFEAGTYENTFTTIHGCDSVITTSVTLLPTEELFYTLPTCNQNDAGTFISYLPNLNGCDTIVHTTLVYHPPDTTLLNQSSCVLANTGISTVHLTNSIGCDSVIITNTSYLTPADTTTLLETTCDILETGMFQLIVSDQLGCDSLILTTIILAPPDTTWITIASCDPDEIGTYTEFFQGVMGCDSLVITTIAQGAGDTTYTNATSCDPGSLGVFEYHFIGQDGCDSTVFNTVTFSAQDSTFLALSSCQWQDTGIFVTLYTNIFGCDSIVTTTVQLLQSDLMSSHAFTCYPSNAGIFLDTFSNQFGCDSLVTTTIEYIPPDETLLFNVTCDEVAAGVFQSQYVNHYGCDSMVIETITYTGVDTTNLLSTSCDSASLGTFELHFTSASGCDSVIIHIIMYSAQDSTFLYDITCVAGDEGVFHSFYLNRYGCDSIVIQNIVLVPPDQISITGETCDPALAGVFITTYLNVFGCDSIVTETITLLPSDQTIIEGTTCRSSEAGTFVAHLQNQFGCDSLITTIISLVQTDTTFLTAQTCLPEETGIIDMIVTGQGGCDSVVRVTSLLYPLPTIQIEITSNYNGIPISCAHESDGSVFAQATGVLPLTYLWSTGEVAPMITGVSAGAYEVTVTDGIGCIGEDVITLAEPEELTMTFSITSPDCFDEHSGMIIAETNGGTTPIEYSIDGIHFQSSPVFDQLGGGAFEITAVDANGCEVKEIILINVPLSITIDLGGDQVSGPGDTSILQALVNVPYDSLASIQWTGLHDPLCPTCLSQPVIAFVTTTYTVSVTTVDGCSDEDSLTLYIEKNKGIYVPNIFSPNDDGINDRLLISAGKQVEEIESFSVFDRWGNMVFFNEHFMPNDPNEAWDGGSAALTNRASRPFNPGVFAYRLIVRFKNQRVEVRYGDVTLITND